MHDQDFSFKNNKLSYLLTYMSFGYVNPTIQQFQFLSVGFFVFSAVTFMLKKKKVDRLLLALFSMLSVLLIAQGFKFQNFNIGSFVGQFIIFLLPYFIFRLVGQNFLILFPRLLYYFTVIGLFFWFFSNLFDPFHQFLQDLVRLLGTDPENGESFLIYNIDWHREEDILFMKNPGPFNEGGVYSCYLIMALVMRVFNDGKLWARENVVFMIAILTTTSTAGFVALFSFIIFYYFFSSKLLAKVFVLPIIAAVSLFVFFQVPFLYEKIEKQFKHQTSLSIDRDVRIGRFHSAMVGLTIIRDNPVFGKGLYKDDRYQSDKERLKGITGSSNGVVDLISKLGLIVGGFYFVLLFRGIKCINIESTRLINPLVGYLPLLLVGMAQNPFNSPVYLVFIYLVAKKSD